MTSATEILRRLLDERGVEYEVQREGKLSESVVWDGPIGTKHSAFVSNENPDRRVGEILYATLFVTPEQAIDATLGRGTCRDVGRYAFVCSECGWASDEPHHVLGGFWPSYCPNCGREVKWNETD